jgi:hypothetical protein
MRVVSCPDVFCAGARRAGAAGGAARLIEFKIQIIH